MQKWHLEGGMEIADFSLKCKWHLNYYFSSIFSAHSTCYSDISTTNTHNDNKKLIFLYLINCIYAHSTCHSEIATTIKHNDNILYIILIVFMHISTCYGAGIQLQHHGGGSGAHAGVLRGDGHAKDRIDDHRRG